ncbi:MAG: HD domain-containing protein [Pseudomonadota bacterium]
MSRLGRAFEIAFAAHWGQTDKSGQPYMAHVVRVASRVAPEDAQIVALLHDVVEDTQVTLDTIRDVFGTFIADAVDAITRRDGEGHDAYLDRVAANPLAKAVKIADLNDNSDPVRMAQLDQLTQARLAKKYAAARERLH